MLLIGGTVGSVRVRVFHGQRCPGRSGRSQSPLVLVSSPGIRGEWDEVPRGIVVVPSAVQGVVAIAKAPTLLILYFGESLAGIGKAATNWEQRGVSGAAACRQFLCIGIAITIGIRISGVGAVGEFLLIRNRVTVVIISGGKLSQVSGEPEGFPGILRGRASSDDPLRFEETRWAI